MFWSNSNFEPKMDFKWYVVLRGKKEVSNAFIERNKRIDVKPPDSVNKGSEKLFLAHKVQKPSFEISTKQYNLINRPVNIPGNVTWGDVSLSLIDTVDNSVTDFLKYYFFLANVAYDFSNQTGIANIETVDKSHLANIDFIIRQIDSEENIIEEWNLVNPMITSLEMSELDYSSDSLSQYNLKIKYDWAFEGEIDLKEQIKAKNKPKENQQKEANNGRSQTAASSTTPQSKNRIGR
jgi:hypothetical protein